MLIKKRKPVKLKYTMIQLLHNHLINHLRSKEKLKQLKRRPIMKRKKLRDSLSKPLLRDLRQTSKDLYR